MSAMSFLTSTSCLMVRMRLGVSASMLCAAAPPPAQYPAAASGSRLTPRMPCCTPFMAM